MELEILNDTPPDYYKDTGCSVASACLTCPFPQCRYDTGTSGGAKKLTQITIDQDRAKVYWSIVLEEGPDIAMVKVTSIYSITKRTMQRTLSNTALRGDVS